MKKIFLIIVFIFILSTYTTAKYFEKIEISSENRIERPIIKIESDEKIIINEITENEIDYNFLIKNYDNDKINNINLEYKIIIESELDNEKVKYCLIDDKNKIIELRNNETYYKKIKSHKSEDKYKLNINFGEEKLINGKINIKIEVIQREG